MELPGFEYISRFLSLQAISAFPFMGFLSMLCFILWIVAIALLIWGTIRVLLKGRVGFLRAGSILMAVTVIVFYIFAYIMSADVGTPTMMPVFCIIASIAAFLLSFFTKKTAR